MSGGILVVLGLFAVVMVLAMVAVLVLTVALVAARKPPTRLIPTLPHTLAGNRLIVLPHEESSGVVSQQDTVARELDRGY